MERLNKLIKCGLAAVLAAGMGALSSIFPVQRTYAQTTTATTFIDKYKSDVKKASSKYNLYGSVMMAQAALESSWGQSQLTTQANNFFGIKGAYNGQSVSMSTVEYNSNGQMVNTTANFKKYPTAYSSFADNGATLRNGTSWDPKYYSGSWKENAENYAAAANALTGKYATAPNYGTSLINLIQTYGLDQVFGEASATSSSAASSSSSSTSSTSSSSNTTSTATSASPLATVKYYHSSGSDQATLSGKYKKYYVYNHIKGASRSEKKYTWQSLGVKKPVSVYLDMRGVKQGTSGSWYRLRFYQNTKAKKFWVYSSALKFAPTYYGTTSGRLTPNLKSNQAIYNHVSGTPQLSKTVTKVKALKATKTGYSVDKTALQSSKSGPILWYRVALGKKKGWIKGAAVTSYPASVAIANANLTKVIVKGTDSALLFDQAVKTGNMQKHYKLAQTSLKVGTKVVADKIGFKIQDHSIWYRITIPGTHNKYWISSKSLS
ncbi:glycoside hydrolase family 73 protein [Lentilactobacillus fungorum]|uniref:glycoside hydrolase family 73 protein n=1 Tax=Lentilactobacillus fungorum TaxID=2201250 RepID=UPI001E3C7208|nr:glucosaminidase domain-containing protein [Lentilactobacillus fungorum]